MATQHIRNYFIDYSITLSLNRNWTFHLPSHGSSYRSSTVGFFFHVDPIVLGELSKIIVVDFRNKRLNWPYWLKLQWTLMKNLLCALSQTLLPQTVITYLKKIHLQTCLSKLLLFICTFKQHVSFYFLLKTVNFMMF